MVFERLQLGKFSCRICAVYVFFGDFPQTEGDQVMSLNRIQIVLFLVVSVGLAAQDASAYYAPEMGQFISRDPIEYRAGDVSL